MARTGPAKSESAPASEPPPPAAAVKQSLEAAFLDYVGAVHRAYADANKRSAETYQAYQRELGERYAELQKRFEDLQRDYVGGIQEAFGRDDAAPRVDKAYQESVGAYRTLVEDAQREAEDLNKKLTSMLGEQSDELSEQCTAALQGYLKEMRAAIQKMSGDSVRVSDLEYLSRSVGTVALYAGATGALAR